MADYEEDEDEFFAVDVHGHDQQAFDSEDHREKSKREEEEDDDNPSWLLLESDIEDDIREDAEAKAEYLDSLGDDCGVADLDSVCQMLQTYLIGHPTGLVTKKRKFPGKGGKSRYFGEEKSDDVMADKVVTGCWACSKLDHESDACQFKRCFTCSEQGHEFSECKRRSIICQKCKRPGHDWETCPSVEYDAALDNEVDSFFVRCLNCNEEGHFNCSVVPTAVILAPRTEASMPRPPSQPPPKQNGWGQRPPWGPQPPSRPPPQQDWQGSAGWQQSAPSRAPLRPSAPRDPPWAGQQAKFSNAGAAPWRATSAPRAPGVAAARPTPLGARPQVSSQWARPQTPGPSSASRPWSSAPMRPTSAPKMPNRPIARPTGAAWQNNGGASWSGGGWSQRRW